MWGAAFRISGWVPSREVDIDVLEEVPRERVPAIADQPRVRHVVAVAVAVDLVRHVDVEDTLHLADRGGPLGAIRQLALAFVQAVVLRQAKARDVGAADVAAVS